MCWKLLVLDEPSSRGLVHSRLSVVFLTGIMVIGHTQVRLTADHKWMLSDGSTCCNGLKQNKPAAIPLVNEGVGIPPACRVVIGKGEECVTIDDRGLHVVCPISLKRLQFDKVSS